MSVCSIILKFFSLLYQKHNQLFAAVNSVNQGFSISAVLEGPEISNALVGILEFHCSVLTASQKVLKIGIRMKDGEVNRWNQQH